MKVFTTSDHHFNHVNIIKFQGDHRPFESVEEMNAVMIARWNEVVMPNDWVIHVGDFALGQAHHVSDFVGQLNGNIVLIRGNHDRSQRFCYNAGFKVVLNRLQINDILFTHKPQTPDKLKDILYNFHGHTHKKEAKNSDPAHVNICVEVTNFYPIDITELISADQLRRCVGCG